jgi:hypothetical protein
MMMSGFEGNDFQSIPHVLVQKQIPVLCGSVICIRSVGSTAIVRRRSIIARLRLAILRYLMMAAVIQIPFFPFEDEASQSQDSPSTALVAELPNRVPAGAGM